MSFTPVPGELISSKLGTIKLALQSAKGTYPTEADVQLSVVSDGAVQVDTEYGTQAKLDGHVFSNHRKFKKMISASTSPTCEASVEELTYILAAAFGNETFTAGDVDSAAQHVINSLTTGGRWVSAWGGIGGDGEKSYKHHIKDAKIGRIEITGSRDSNGVVQYKTEVVALTSERYHTEPSIKTGGISSHSEAFVWTEADATLVIGGFNSGNPIEAVNEIAITIDFEYELIGGSGVEGYAIALKDSNITVKFSVVLDELTLGLLNTELYGAAQPAAGATPVTDTLEFALGWRWHYGADEEEKSLAFSLPRVSVEIEDIPAPSAEGGAIELSFSGRANRGNDGSAGLTVTALDAATAAYVS